MFSLFKGAYGEISRKDEFFVAVLGLEGVGKTTYMERVKALFDNRYRVRDLSKITSTVGLNHIRIQLRDMIVNFWDLGGDKQLRSLWSTYLNDCHAVCFFIDSNDATRLDEAIETLDEIFIKERIKNLPIMILFNKCDLDGQQHDQHKINPQAVKMSNKDADLNGSNSLIKEAESMLENGKICSSAIENVVCSPAPSNGWQSFELDDVDCSWEAGSFSSNPVEEEHYELKERFRKDYFTERLADLQGDVAMFSISAKRGEGINKSITWLINALKLQQQTVIKR